MPKLNLKTKILIAIVTALLYGVVSYYGHYFNTFGSESESIITALVFFILLIVFSLLAILLKTTSKKFKVCRFFEYLCILAVLVIPFVGFNNICACVSVTRHKDSIEKEINKCITESHQLFTDYESYVEKRKKRAKKNMEALIANREQRCTELWNSGFSEIPCEKLSLLNDRKENFIKLLDADLKIDTTQATEWLKKFQDASILNPSVVDYAKVLPDSIKKWNNDREERGALETRQQYEPKQTFEPYTKKVSVQDFETLFKRKDEKLKTILLCLVFGILLLLPWYTSKRDSRAEGLDWLGRYRNEDYEEIL